MLQHFHTNRIVSVSNMWKQRSHVCNLKQKNVIMKLLRDTKESKGEEGGIIQMRQMKRELRHDQSDSSRLTGNFLNLQTFTNSGMLLLCPFNFS